MRRNSALRNGGVPVPGAARLPGLCPGPRSSNAGRAGCAGLVDGQSGGRVRGSAPGPGPQTPDGLDARAGGLLLLVPSRASGLRGWVGRMGGCPYRILFLVRPAPVVPVTAFLGCCSVMRGSGCSTSCVIMIRLRSWRRRRGCAGSTPRSWCRRRSAWRGCGSGRWRSSGRRTRTGCTSRRTASSRPHARAWPRTGRGASRSWGCGASRICAAGSGATPSRSHGPGSRCSPSTGPSRRARSYGPTPPPSASTTSSRCAARTSPTSTRPATTPCSWTRPGAAGVAASSTRRRTRRPSPGPSRPPVPPGTPRSRSHRASRTRSSPPRRRPSGSRTAAT